MSTKTIAAAIAAFVILIVGYSAAFYVDETELVIVVQFGEYKRTVSKPGIAYKVPFAQTAIKIEKRILASDAHPEEYLTEDKKRLVADPITRWRVKKPLEFYKSVRDELRARKRLDDLVLSELRQELAKRQMSAIVGHGRDKMMAIVTKAVHIKAKEYGIDVVDVRIKRLDLPKEVQRSVFDRMVAERERQAKKYRSEGQEESDKITSKTDKEQTIILATAYETAQKMRGDGDAMSTKIYADAYGKDPEFYSFMRNLKAYEASINKDATIVMSTGSQLFRYLTQPGKSPTGDVKRAAEPAAKVEPEAEPAAPEPKPAAPETKPAAPETKP